MNQFRFRAVKQNFFKTECGHYKAYSICAEQQAPQGYINTLIIPDVSCDKEFAVQLAEQCTRKQLSPLHLLDVVLDMLP